MATTRILGASRVAPGLFDDIDEIDDFGDFGEPGDPLFRWQCRTEQTRPPVGDAFREVAAVVKRWTPTNLPMLAGSFAHVCNVYSVMPIDLDFEAGQAVLVRLTHYPEGPVAGLVETVPPTADDTADISDAVADVVAESDEVGAPSSALLVDAVAQLRVWLRMQQKDLATYVGISNSTVMAWKREAPRYPRHKRIPVLLSLWAAVAAARDELGDEATSRLIWGRGEEANSPAVPAEELTEVLLGAATEASDASWLEDDGYVPAQSAMPSADEFLEAESALSEGLSAAHRGGMDDDREAGAPRA
jgi:DNA-binding transcriptional regulator YiaG